MQLKVKRTAPVVRARASVTAKAADGRDGGRVRRIVNVVG